MNRTKIEWTDWTWNPVTGCWGPGGTAEKPNRCWYCYAWRMGGRFLSGNSSEKYDPFAPKFYPDRLDQPSRVKKPSKIFVCSMGDLFGDWVLREWIEAVLNRTQRADYCHHTYQFLTKNPKRLLEFNPWPPNCRVGCTITNQADADERLPWLLKVEALVRFVSHEPLLGAIDVTRYLPRLWTLRGHDHPTEPGNGIDWAIIGGMTGPGAVKPKPEWVQGLIDQYRAAGVRVFLKDNLKWPEKIQEWPMTLKKGLNL